MITCLALLILAAPITSIPPDPVLVLQSDVQSPRSGLLQALRIQQVRFRVMEYQPVHAGPPLPAQEPSPAFALLDKHPALLVVWTERKGAALLLHIAGRRDGAPFIDQMHFEAGDEPAMDRAFALKIRDVLDELVIARLSLSLPDAGPPPRRGVEQRAPRVLARQAPPDAAWVIELGGRGMDGQGNGGHGAVVLSGSRQARLQPGTAERFAELYTELTLAPATTIRSPDGDMSTSAVEGMLGVRALTAAVRQAPERWLGGIHLGAGAGLVRAQGTTPQGASGTARRLVPMLAAGVEGRLGISPRLAVRAAIGAAMSLRRQRFALNDMPIVDLGRYRVQGQLSLLLSLP